MIHSFYNIRFYPCSSVDEVLNEFEACLDPFYSKDSLRAIRYIALFCPFEDLNISQIERILNVIVLKVSSFKRISTQFDVFIAYMMKKVLKSNMTLLRDFDWGPLSELAFEKILPNSLKIPSPVRGANRKVGKLLSKTDVEMGEDIFDSLGKEVNARVSKWIVYAMQADCYTEVIHGKLLFFLDSLRNLCHPANFGPWCIQIELFLGYIAGLISKQSNIDPKWLAAVSTTHIDEVICKIWELSELLVYARSGPALSGMCVSSFTCTYLANIRPAFIIPKLIESISSALESVSEPHRTTSALGLLHITMPNLMNVNKSFSGVSSVLSLLPTVVFGIDVNDQLKTIRTLSLFLSFAESALIKDISGMHFNCPKWNESCQEAKELTGQYSEIFMVFTENVISYLKTSSSQNPSELDDISRMILAIGNCVYARLSDEIASICLEKWIDLLEEDLNTRLFEIIGEIISNLGKRQSNGVTAKLIPKLVAKIEEQVFEKGEGKLGSKDQSNNSLNNNLCVLASVLENSRAYIESNSQIVFEFILKLLNCITNRKSFSICSRLFHSVATSLTRWEIREIIPEIRDNENPFDVWCQQWKKVEELKPEVDFYWIKPTESTGLLAISLLDSVVDWSTTQLSSLLLSNEQGKVKSEQILSVLEVIDNLNITLLNFYNLFSLYNYEINSELHVPEIAQSIIRLLQVNLTNLKRLSDFSGNLEIEIRLIEIVGSLLKGNPVNSDRSREKLKSLKRLNINYDRFLRDKHNRPKSFWILKAEAQFKLRRDLRFELGDTLFESEIMAQFKDLSECILYSSCFKKYHMIRAASQHLLRAFTHKYSDEMSFVYISRTLDLIESSDNLSEHEFKGICFLLKNHYVDVISDHFDLIDRLIRGLMKLSTMPVAEEISESFDILNSLLNEFSNSFVPENDCIEKVKQLIIDCFSFATENDGFWTRQYLALLSAHPLLELVSCPEVFASLATLTLSKVSTIRNLAQNCFRMALFSYVKALKPDYFRYRDVSTFDIYRSKSFIEKPQLISNREQFPSFESFSMFFCEYLKYLCLNEGEESGSNLKFEYGNFLNIGRLVVLNLGGVGDAEKFIDFLLKVFPENQMEDLGKQRALAEIISAFLCNFDFDKLNKNAQSHIKSLMSLSWSNLAIENIELWTCAIDEPLMMNSFIISEIVQLFHSEKSTTSTILGMKLLFSIYSQIGLLSFHEDAVELAVVSKLMGFHCDDSSMNSQVVMESSKLLAMIYLKRPDRRDMILKHFQVDSHTEQISRARMNFLAHLSTIPDLTDYWNILKNKGQLLEMLVTLQSGENVQLLADSKKALLTLFLAKGATLDDLNGISHVVINFLSQNSSSLPSKISKFCVELIQIMVQNNFFLFHRNGSASKFMLDFIDPLVESEHLDLRESSHGLALTIYQIDPISFDEAAKSVTRSLTKMRTSIKDSAKLKERHSLVIRASALILSEQHLINKHLPPLLTILSYYISDKSPISPLVRTTFSEFRRTHQDNWDSDRQLFDEDQLDAIGELLIAPSYYA